MGPGGKPATWLEQIIAYGNASPMLQIFDFWKVGTADVYGTFF